MRVFVIGKRICSNVYQATQVCFDIEENRFRCRSDCIVRMEGRFKTGTDILVEPKHCTRMSLQEFVELGCSRTRPYDQIENRMRKLAESNPGLVSERLLRLAIDTKTINDPALQRILVPVDRVYWNITTITRHRMVRGKLKDAVRFAKQLQLG